MNGCEAACRFVDGTVLTNWHGHWYTYCLQEKLKQVFDNLIQLDHANLVKFHKYWTDTKGDKRRVSIVPPPPPASQNIPWATNAG